MKSMKEQYGKKRGETVFYASLEQRCYKRRRKKEKKEQKCKN